nr:hypothetical protein [Tanacetum cinerariifolium]
GGYKAAALGIYQRNNANPSYQERRQSMEDTLSKLMSVSINKHEENSNLIKEIRASMDVAVCNQADSCPIHRIGSSQYAVSTGETFVLNRSLDHFFEDYIELNDLNKPIELMRNQGDDLMPTIKEGEIIEEFRTRDEDHDTGIDDYPSYYDYDKKIHIDCAHNLKFSYMIGFKFTHANLFPLLYVNVMSKKCHNSIMKDKMVYKGDNVVGTLTNVPIFVGNFYVVMNFAVLENMDVYHDEGMGDVIVGEPFLREVRIKARRFEGTITLYKDDKSVSDDDMMNGIWHPYQNLKGFYKGLLNLGPNYIQYARMEEWLTSGHISVHEME